MKTLKKSTLAVVLIAVVMLIIVNPGCKKKDEPAPEIPPSSTFLMDFKNFDDTSSVSSNKATYVNWLHSAANVAVWNVIITVGLAVPVASFLESFNHEAEYNHQDKYWTWSYNFNSWGTHSAELKGYIESDSVVWEMRIDGFLWYYGHSHTNGSGGYWLINESNSQQTPLLRINWQRNSTGVSSIKYLNVAANTSTHAHNRGEFIEYGTVSSGEFDRFYDIYLIDNNNTSLNNMTEIEWNFADKHGRVKDELKFGNTDWNCWDTNFADTSCQ